MYEKWRKEINETEKYARVSTAPFFWRQFEGATALPVRLLLLAQTSKAEQHARDHEDCGGILFRAHSEVFLSRRCRNAQNVYETAL